jgi:sterol desaturase/sphingolipid hydroxylase (fatty acid hydroxylase superfamily)
VRAGERVPDVDLAGVKTLADAARLFFSQPVPRLLAGHAAAAWGLRAFLGPPRLTEIPTAGAVIAWWPLQEWLAHRYLLHFAPRTVLGRRVDPAFARRHRAHHRAPRELGSTLLPIELVRAGIPVSAAVFAVFGLGSPRRAVTAAATYATMALLYEWTHFLVHTGYRPRSRLFKKIRRNHRLHHFHHEGHWLGFTFPWIDTILGTDPDPRDLAHSETATRLHGMAD